jgi:DNA-binding beta-propeller fold protein YncE
VYAHAAAGPKYAKEQLDNLSIQLTGGDEIRVAYDNHAAYQYWWYLRRYPNAQDVGATPGRELIEYPVVFAGEENYAKFEAFLGDDYSSLVYERMWWPIQDYFNLTWESFKNVLTDPEMRNAIWNIWLDRDYRAYARLKGKDLSPRGWQPASKMKMYVHNDLAGAIPGMGYEEPIFEPASFSDPYLASMVELVPDQIIGGSGAEPGLFSSPRGLALGAGGAIYVADSQNHRIQVFDEGGQVLNTWGTFSDAITGDASEGAFNQPWDVATGPDHEVVVADTWNHRVQYFDENGEFISSFGTHGIGAGIDALWGPRSAAVDHEGRIFISDTGNKRIVVFDPSGSTISEIGMGGVGLGQLDEPVGLAIDLDGRLYVADTWNMRVQIFEETIPGTFEAVADWPVEAWYGQSLENKPYIAVSPEKHVCVSDPEGARILCFSEEGEFLTGWHSPGMNLPSGVVFDENCNLWVSDAGSDRLLRFETGFCEPN